ncbi:MAG TPA: acylphosphatase [bacterium]|jgi:acylphosphatase|nr:acylphosphatase [bacterium]
MTDRDRVRGRLWVTGMVQGVGFRYFAQRTARSLGLGGSARNLADGRVEIVVEGPTAAVEEFLTRVRTGPSAARVRGVQVEWEAPSGTGEFLIR